MITLCTCRGHHSDQHVCHAYAGLCSCRALASLANLAARCACAQAFSYRDSLSGTSMTARVAGFCFLLTVAFRSRGCTLRARYPLGKPQRTLSSAAASGVVSEVASGKAFAASRGRLGKNCGSPARSRRLWKNCCAASAARHPSCEVSSASSGTAMSTASPVSSGTARSRISRRTICNARARISSSFSRTRA